MKQDELADAVNSFADSLAARGARSEELLAAFLMGFVRTAQKTHPISKDDALKLVADTWEITK